MLNQKKSQGKVQAKKATIALVNEDKTSSFNKKDYNFGRDFVNLVSGDTKYNWQVVSRPVADRAYSDSSVDAVIYIPQSFSHDILTLQDIDPMQAKVNYKLQENQSTLSQKLLDDKITDSLYDFNQKIVKMYYASVAGNISEAQNNMTDVIRSQENVLTNLSKNIYEPFQTTNQGYSSVISNAKGYQAYFVLKAPVYVTSKSEFKSVKAAKIISQNIREYFGKTLPVDMTCNHFGIARIPRTDNVEFFDPNYRYSFKEWQDWSFKQTDDKGFTRSSLTVLSGTEGKKQVDEPWFNLLLHETKFSGEKGLVGRNSVMFTLSLAYFSSGYSIDTCEYNMFEFNNRLDQPLEEKEVIKIVRSAYSENYQGANREYITILCKAWVSSDLTSKDLFVRQGWFKFKKKRSERQRVHLSEWKEDLMAYISEKSYVYKPYLVTTKKEIREALGIPERTLDKLLKVLKANQEIFFKVKPGRNGGIQLANVKSLLLSIIKLKKEERESYIKALTASFNLERTFIQETLNKLAERPKTATQLDLFGYDTG